MFNTEYANDLIWANPEHSNFKCKVKFKEFDEVLPCGVTAADPYTHIKTLWSNGLAGVYGPIAEYVPLPEPEIIAEQPQPTQTNTEQF